MLDTLFNHKSIRKYKEKPIPQDMLTKVLGAGARASNTGNMQVYSMIVSRDQETREKLWEAHFKQDMVKTAPVTITFCADLNRFHKWCNLRAAKPGYDNFLWFMNGAIDAILASQNVSLAAEAYGLGICYLGTTTYMAGKIIEILDIPELVVPVTSIVMGYPDEEPGLADRLPLEGVVHQDTYIDYFPDEINEIYDEKEKSELTKELLKINNKETLAQVFTENRYTKKDNEMFSKKYLEVVKKQGFKM